MRKALYILSQLDESDVRWLVENGTLQTIKANETLIRIGVVIQTLYIVIDGRLAVTIKDGQQIAVLAAGDIIGEMSLVEKRPPSGSVVTLEKARVLAIPQQLIAEKLREDSHFAARFYHALAIFLSDRLRSTVDHLGYGDTAKEDTMSQFEDEHELDDNLLDTLHIAGDRMRHLIALLEGAEP